MIPDFKTYIGESTWNDIRRQSAGRQGRAEDDMSFVNKMNKYELYEFLNKRYKINPRFKNNIGDLGQSLAVPVFTDGTKSFSVLITAFYDGMKNRNVFVHGYFVTEADDMFEKLGDKFWTGVCYNSADKPDWADIYPDEKKENVTNLFFIEVIDFLLDNLLPKYTNMIIRQD